MRLIVVRNAAQVGESVPAIGRVVDGHIRFTHGVVAVEHMPVESGPPCCVKKAEIGHIPCMQTGFAACV